VVVVVDGVGSRTVASTVISGPYTHGPTPSLEKQLLFPALMPKRTGPNPVVPENIDALSE
jgi:hypothetical protein